VVEEMPRFAGCEEEATVEARKACADKKMLEFIYKNLHYPAPAREKKIEGIVVVSFIIEKDGSVSNAEIKREIGGGCGEETLRVIGLMPRWIPGKQKGEVVRVQMNLPVRYKLDTATDQKEVIADHSIIIDSDKKELKTSVDGVPMVIGMKDEKSENKPLFFVNGERLSNEDGDLSHINPDNIKEVSVLKGEKAIAYAGPEGQNGVVLITLYKPGEKPMKVPTVGGGDLFKVVEEMPYFPGCEDLPKAERKACGDKKMLEFIYQNLRYPALARENGVEGTVVVTFIVEADGRIKEPKIVREIGGGCGDEVLRVVNLMPTWIPGKQKGEAVRVQFNLPVRFKLEGDEKTDNAPNAASKALPVEDFKIFPNPSKGRFTVSFSAPQKNTEIQVLNAEGSAVFSRVLNQFPGTFRDEIDLGKAPKGNYVLVVRQGELVHTANIVKQ
jgi:TonB family protein